MNPTAQKPSAAALAQIVRADSRRPSRGRARVRPPRAVAGRADPGDRQLHPGRRRQADPAGRTAHGRAHGGLHGRAGGAVRLGDRVHPHRDARPRRHHRRVGAAPGPRRRAHAVGQPHHGAVRRLPLSEVDVAGADAGRSRDHPAPVRRHTAHRRRRDLPADQERRRWI